MRIFLEESSTPFLVLQAHSSVAVIAFSPDGQTLATGGRDNLVKIWHLEQGMLLATLQGHSKFMQGIAFSRDGMRLATGSLDGTYAFGTSYRFRSFTSCTRTHGE